jgi:putative mRNA 3-end processing factor
MQIRGTRRRRAVDRGFVLSDHADWPGLLATIQATGATRIGVTHGYTAALVRYLREQGYDAAVFQTRFEGDAAEEAAESAEVAAIAEGDAKGDAIGDVASAADSESVPVDEATLTSTF